MHCMLTNVDSNITQEHVYIHIGHAQKHINTNHSYYYQASAIITREQQSVDISSHDNPFQTEPYWYLTIIRRWLTLQTTSNSI